MTWQLATGYIFFLVLVLWFVFVVVNYATHRRFWTHRRHELLLITVPLGGEVQPFAADHKLSEIGATSELLQRFAKYRMTFSVEAAVHHVGEEIHFYIYAPKRHKREIVRDVESIFPGAKITPADYDIWMEGGQVEVAHVHQSKPFMVPLRCASVPTHDPFRIILRHLSKVRVLGEGVALQWIIKPLATKRVRECVSLVGALKKGAAPSFRLIDEGFLVTPQTIEVLEEKLSGPLYSVNCRIVVAHARKDEAKKLLRGIEEAFSGSSAGMLYNELYVVPAKKQSRSLAMFTNRVFDEKEEMIMNVQELATLFHFPIRHSTAPKIHRG